MQDGLAAGITHGIEGRALADVAAYNPSSEADYVSALQRLQNINFSLLAELRSSVDGYWGTSDIVHAPITTALSITLAFANTVAPITVDDYGVIGTDDWAGADADPFPNMDDAELNMPYIEIGEEAGVEKRTERGSNDTKELVSVLTSMDAANFLTSGVQAVSVPPVAKVFAIGVPTSSGPVPTVSAIFTTASMVISYSRHPRGISAKDKEEEMARDDQMMNEHIARDAEIARIHAEEELKMMIDGLDRSNEVIAKHLHDYEQAAADLTIREKIELINELVKYQDHHAKILNYQAQ
nr:hypothetical protein [Tanacetum cinerariifolium]